MAEPQPENSKEITPPNATQVRLNNIQHTLSCMDPECLLPHCVNIKLALKHTQGCKKTDCRVCQQMKFLASQHSESCSDLYCCMPFCMEEKLQSFIQSHFGQIDGCLDAASQSQKGEAVLAEGTNSSSSNSSNKTIISSSRIGCGSSHGSSSSTSYRSSSGNSSNNIRTSTSSSSSSSSGTSNGLGSGSIRLVSSSSKSRNSASNRMGSGSSTRTANGSSNRSSNIISSSSSHDSLSNDLVRSFTEQTTTQHNTRDYPSFSLNNSNESTPDQSASIEDIEGEDLSRHRSNSYPQVKQKRLNRSTSLNTFPVHAKNPRLQPNHSRCQSLFSQSSVRATSQWDTFMEPFSASHEGPSIASTQPTHNPSFVVTASMHENAATKQQGVREISSSAFTAQSKAEQSQPASQSTTNAKIQKTTDLFSAACLSSVAEASHSAPSAVGHVTGDSNTLLKARLIHTLYDLLQLIMQKLETREEILISIKSLRNALQQMKTLQ